ncbi:hypothetical protein Hanom_Chr08g00703821 [Helianthus anomalus]
MSITTKKRILKSLKKNTNLNIVKEVLYNDDNMVRCHHCYLTKFLLVDYKLITSL